MSTDLLEDVLAGAREGHVVVGNGETHGGWHVYSSSVGGSWVADELRSPQAGHALHLRTADRGGTPGAYATWHRSYFRTHFATPVVHCSFRVDSHDASRDSLGFKMHFLHQDNNHSFYVMLMVDGRAMIYREARDGADEGKPGTVLTRGEWDYRPGVRRNLRVAQSDSGQIDVWLDNELILSALDGVLWQSGQIGFRLDGLDARIMSLVVESNKEVPVGMPAVLALPQEAPSDWGSRVDYDSWNAQVKQHVTVHYTGVSGYQKARLDGGHSGCDDAIRRIENDHMDGHGWDGIGYNFVICPHSTLYRCRGEAWGAHNPSDSDLDGIPDNKEAIGVMLMTGPGETPTPGSLDTLQKVCDALGHDKVYPHNAQRATSCPGSFLTQWSADYTADSLPDPEPDPEEPTVSEWKYPKHVEPLREAGIFSKWTKPAVNVDTDNLSAYLDRLLTASAGLVRVEDKPTVYTVSGQYLIPVSSPEQARVHVVAAGGDGDKWGRYVRSITEEEFEHFTVLDRDALA